MKECLLHLIEFGHVIYVVHLFEILLCKILRKCTCSYCAGGGEAGRGDAAVLRSPLGFQNKFYHD